MIDWIVEGLVVAALFELSSRPRAPLAWRLVAREVLAAQDTSVIGMALRRADASRVVQP